MNKILLSLLAFSCIVQLSAVPYQRKAPKTYIFSRAQWHYTPELDYYGRWLDRPLLLDPEMLNPVDVNGSIARNSKLYNLAGLASLYGAGTRNLIRSLEQAKVPDFTLLAETYCTGGGMYDRNKELKAAKLNFDQVFLPALKSKLTLKIGGKTVISSYNADKRPARFWKDVLDLYRKECGDKFIFIPHLVVPQGRAWHNWSLKWHKNNNDPEVRNAIQEHYREYLRATDGLYLDCAPTVTSGDRHTDMDFYQYMIDTATEVLAEPEFKDKIFAISSRLGHKNGTRVGYIRGSFGTWCYRGTLSRAIAANPDIIIIPEWDEQNENTSLRPTLYNHSTFTRLTRCMTGASADLPGDDLNIPNLVMSYRKVVALGEAPEFELLSLPGDKPVSARFILRGESGRILYSSPWTNFSGKKIEEFRCAPDSTKWAGEGFATIEVETRRGNNLRKFGNMQYIRIEPVVTFDYKYVKQPLRDILNANVEYKMDSNGCFAAKVDSPDSIDWAELMENAVEIYTHAGNNRPFMMETPEEFVFTIRAQCIDTPQWMTGSMSVSNAPSTWYGTSVPVENSVSGKISFRRHRQTSRMKRWIVSVPAAKINQAVLNVDIPGFFKESIPLSKVVKNGVYGFNGSGRVAMTVVRQNYQSERPIKLRKRSFEVNTPAFKGEADSVFNFQLVAANGKVWRSKPFRRVKLPAETARISVWSETLKKPVFLKVPAVTVPVVEYRPNPETGTAILTPAGRKYAGIAGGYTSQVSGLYGAYRDSTCYITAGHFPRKARKISVPIVDGAWKLDDHNAATIQLPTGLISRRAAFNVSMDVKQTAAGGKQTLMETRASQIGLFSLIWKNGQLYVILRNFDGYGQYKPTGLKFPLNKWCKLTCDFSLNKMVVSVDNKRFEINAEGMGVFDTAFNVGGGMEGAFKGSIKNIRVSYHR